MSFHWIISKFKDYVDLIYLIEPEIKSTARYGSYIVLHIEINSKDRFKTKLIIFDMNYLYDMSRNHGVIKKSVGNNTMDIKLSEEIEWGLLLVVGSPNLSRIKV